MCPFDIEHITYVASVVSGRIRWVFKPELEELPQLRKSVKTQTEEITGLSRDITIPASCFFFLPSGNHILAPPPPIPAESQPNAVSLVGYLSGFFFIYCRFFFPIGAEFPIRANI